jgi:LAO/AO transport system kinase
VVNKADRDGADATYRDIQGMLNLAPPAISRKTPDVEEWRPQVVRAVANRGEGIDKLVAAVEKHRAWLIGTGELTRRREARAAAEIEAIALGRLRDRLGSVRDGAGLPKLAARVAVGELDAFTAANDLLGGLSA